MVGVNPTCPQGLGGRRSVGLVPGATNARLPGKPQLPWGGLYLHSEAESSWGIEYRGSGALGTGRRAFPCGRHWRHPAADWRRDGARLCEAKAARGSEIPMGISPESAGANGTCGDPDRGGRCADGFTCRRGSVRGCHPESPLHRPLPWHLRSRAVASFDYPTAASGEEPSTKPWPASDLW